MEFSNYTMQSVYFCNLTRELGCILACVDVIGEDIKGMANLVGWGFYPNIGGVECQ